MRQPTPVPLRCSMVVRCLMVALAFLVIADAHIATALAGDRVIVEATCEARLPTLNRTPLPLIVQTVEAKPPPACQSPSPLLHPLVLASSSLDPLWFPPGERHQDQLHALVHVFLF